MAVIHDNASYNCGGYALRTYTWVHPFWDDDDEPVIDYNGCCYYPSDYTEDVRMGIADRMYESGDYTEAEIVDKIVEGDANFLQWRFPFLKRISADEVDKYARVVGYRIFIRFSDDGIDDQDFHFRICINGFWFEKSGMCEPKLCEKETDENWRSPSGLVYDSQIIYFADERE